MKGRCGLEMHHHRATRYRRRRIVDPHPALAARRLLDRCHGGGPRRKFQILGAGRGEVPPAAGVGDALELGPLLVVDVKTDHVDNKWDTRFLQFPGRGARIRIAGLFAVTYQHDGGGPFLGAHNLRRRPQRAGNRCFPLGVDPLDRGGQRSLVHRTERDRQLHVIAITLSTVAVKDQPDLGRVGHGLDDRRHCLLGDCDLGLALHLPPHAPRSVQDENNRGCLRS